MKRIVTAVAALLITAASFAQGNDSPPPAQQGAPGMHQRVQLTPEQRAKKETDQINSITPMSADIYQKVLDVNTKAATQRAAITGGSKRNEMTDDQRAQMKQLNESHKQQLKDAMGKDLYEKYKMAEREKMQQRRAGEQATPPTDGQK